MNFGSKKVYVYSLSDEESVSGDSETDNEESTSFIFSKISPHTTNRSAPTPSELLTIIELNINGWISEEKLTNPIS